MEDEQVKMIKCNNCHTEIEESKYQIHQGFCLRYNKYCTKCSSAVLSSEFEEHEKVHIQEEEEEKAAKQAKAKAEAEKAQAKVKAQVLTQSTNKPQQEHLNHLIKPVIPTQTPTPHHPLNQPLHPRPVIKPREIIPPKFDLCEYCASYFENIKDHLSECEAKLLIEKEQLNYNQQYKERIKNDSTIAHQIFKEEEKKRPNDVDIAKKLQMEYDKQNPKPKIKDIDLAKKLQDEWDRQHPKPNDAKLAKKLQDEWDRQHPKPKINDIDLAKKLQDELDKQNPQLNNDAELAKKLQSQFKNNYDNQIKNVIREQKQQPKPNIKPKPNPKPIDKQSKENKLNYQYKPKTNK